MSYLTNSPRTEASRKNGAKSNGPVSVAGKARASKNALKHGLRAKQTILLEGEDKTAFEALDQSLKDDLRPSGPLETLLASRLAIAAWRMDRADRIEAELFAPKDGVHSSTLGERMTRDRHGPQAIDCLIRYRGTTQSEFWRALTALRALQSARDDVLQDAGHTRAEPIDVSQPRYLEIQADRPEPSQEPNEPEGR